MRKPKPIENYSWKMDWHLKKQFNKCSGCNELMIWWIDSRDNEYYFKNAIGIIRRIHFAHNFSRTEKNELNYPLMLHSILNTSAQCAPCNIGRKPAFDKTGMTYHQAGLIEDYLNENLIFAAYVNGGPNILIQSELQKHFNEINKIY
jgi:hypothetical protein